MPDSWPAVCIAMAQVSSQSTRAMLDTAYTPRAMDGNLWARDADYFLLCQQPLKRFFVLCLKSLPRSPSFYFLHCSWFLDSVYFGTDVVNIWFFLVICSFLCRRLLRFLFASSFQLSFLALPLHLQTPHLNIVPCTCSHLRNFNSLYRLNLSKWALKDPLFGS